MDHISFNISNIEGDKIKTNKSLFAWNKQRDHFEIKDVLHILNLDTLPIEISLNNNLVFIRDLSSYIVNHNLEPNINK